MTWVAPWSDEKKAEFRAAWERGDEVPDMAARFGITVHSIRQQRMKLGLPKRGSVPPVRPVSLIPTPEVLARITALAADGVSDRAISVEFGVTLGVINGIRGRFKIPKTILPRIKKTPAPRVVARKPVAAVAPGVEPVALVPRPPAPDRPARGCLFPLWGFHERPTHRYCEAATGGRVYCAAHWAKCHSGVSAPVVAVPSVTSLAPSSAAVTHGAQRMRCDQENAIRQVPQ